MFVDFLYHLRAHGLKISTTEWMSLMEALIRGHARCDLNAFYGLTRALCVKKESLFDRYDQSFAAFFDGVPFTFDLSEDLLGWLSNPKLPRELTDEEKALLEAWDLDRLRGEFEARLKEQKKRHDGGNRWVGTGGTSPFGHGGTNPAGVRVGGKGGGRSAIQVASERRFENLRSDRVLDTRQIGAALRRLRKLARDGREEELDVEATIDQSAKNGGEIDLVFSPPRQNRIKLMLLMDVGGSMDPHTELTERLFSAAHAASHFKAFEHYFFHNCPYEKLYSDIARNKGPDTDAVLKKIDATWTLVFVGDAWMSPYELTHRGGAIYYFHNNADTGLSWLKRLREKVPNSVWLNPEPRRIWNAESVRIIRTVFPMFELTLDGLKDAVDMMRGTRPNQPDPAAAHETRGIQFAF
jgi:uncharacterized protein with von Willebrand factor type A (vWA) domain